jgi:hypothetical protein
MTETLSRTERCMSLRVAVPQRLAMTCLGLSSFVLVSDFVGWQRQAKPGDGLQAAKKAVAKALGPFDFAQGRLLMLPPGQSSIIHCPSSIK